MDNEFLLYDRLEKIRSTITKYGEENFYISFSGGKDSCVLSALIDEALPENKIPRVYANTGIEYNEMVKFVKSLQAEDDRIVILPPSVNIKKMLEKEGYPFKSKKHSQRVAEFQKKKAFTNTTLLYARRGNPGNKKLRNDLLCPKCLLHQFNTDYQLKISDMCCYYMKELPLDTFAREHGKKWAITGLMRSEGGRRASANCITLAKTKKGISKFNPLSPVTKTWENWLIDTWHIDLPVLYGSPYNFVRTGCKGCPFAIDLQHNLDVMEKFFPAERAQCERIWAPVYAEYRRLGYRLRKDGGQTNLFDLPTKE